jgi:GNAT superfamily N-acetyltransferase
MLELVQPDSVSLWDVARRLVDEYAASLQIDLSFQNFAQEVRHLETEYGPPHGHFLLARRDGTFVGCGGLRRFSERTCEMKRLYVESAHRSRGIGEAIARALIAEARRLGYDTILLDTLPSMRSAHQLYLALGFTKTPPYRHNPIAGTTYLKLQV